jgi:LPS-assembly protein
MGRSPAPVRPSHQDCPVDRFVGSFGMSSARRLLLWLLVALATPMALTSHAVAQTANDTLKPKTDKNAKMLVEANELVQNTDANTVSAVGNARIYYDGRTLEADKVVYNKTTKRLFAVGHAKLTEKDGTVLHGETFDLTDDFRDGFVDSLRADTTQKTHYSAPRMERIGGETTVFNKGTYTACDACKDHPDRPTLWRVRAKRIIHKNEEQMIYYEDAYLEFLGIPVAYVPYFSAPDPTVTKKSGLLAPKPFYRSQLGYGVGQPIFFNLAPDYDLTLTPTYFSTQGFFGAGEFRQRTDNGLYYIRASGIEQMNPKEFAIGPYGAGDHRFRGDIDTKGEFNINSNWKFGWNIAVLSDKYYLYDYSIPTETLSSNYFSESISTLYLTGQGDRSFFDLHGYYFQGLSSHDIQAQQPIAHPVLDYNKTIDIDPAKTRGVGGQVELDFNLTSLSAQSASYQSVGPRTLDSAYGLYDVCNVYQPGRTSGNSCLLRGIGGDYTRATGQVSYQRKLIDPIGEVWTPFAFARFSGETLNLNTSYTNTLAYNGNVSTYTNASQTNFVDGGTTANLVPGVGLEYRYPFLAYTRFGSMVFEPIGQVIARPNSQIGTRSLVNLDSQSLVFDTANLFDWNKFSGYDRFETGLRANYGAQFSMNFKNGGYANFIVGQSAQIAGTNAYSTPDAANIGLSSGLDKRLSDYVAGATLSPLPLISFGASGRFDSGTLENRRVDLTTQLNFGALTGGVQFANYQAQPVIGYDVRREGLALNAKYKFAENYYTEGNVTFDMSRHLYPAALISYTNPGPFAIAALGIGAGYTDECTTFSVNYTSIYQDNGTGSFERNQTVLLSLQLRTLGDAKFSRSTITNTYSGLDGVK